MKQNNNIHQKLKLNLSFKWLLIKLFCNKIKNLYFIIDVYNNIKPYLN